MDPATPRDEHAGATGEGGTDLRALEAELAKRIAGQPVVCFANDWSGDPTSKHHVMRTLARHTDVLWVESSGMRRPSLNAGDLRRIVGKLRRSRQGTVAPPRESRLRVAAPLAVPLPGNRLAEALNRRIYARTVRRALDAMPGGAHARPAPAAGPGASSDAAPGQAPARAAGPRLPLHWVYTPTVEPYLNAIPGAGMVYHCVDRWWEFSEYDEKVMRRHHEMLCRKADVVFASAEGLVRDCEPFTDRVHLIRHGVDWEHFARAAIEPPPRPADLADVTGPVVGFFGLIHDWIDQELIAAVADALPQATIVLLGKTRVDTGALAARPNVRLLGQKPYADLPAYAARFDVGLIPFVINVLTEAVNPIKLREYMSAGLPVVATPLPEIRIYHGHPRVRIADDRDAFVAGVRDALAVDASPADRADAARAMVSESWLGRTIEMVRLWNESR